MSSSLKERILAAASIAVISAIILCVFYRLIFYREDWLSYSIVWSISWAIGYFIAKSINTLEKGIWINLIIDSIIIIVVAFFVEAFIIGVPIEYRKEIFIKIMVPFSISLIIFNLI